MSTYDELAKLETDSPTPNSKGEGNKLTQESTRLRDQSRMVSSDIPRKRFNKYPTREEIQEFSFRLRDQLKVKVQAEVPHHWQKELDEVARELNVKKLELYRFIIGEFLDKVKRKKVALKPNAETR